MSFLGATDSAAAHLRENNRGNLLGGALDPAQNSNVYSAYGIVSRRNIPLMQKVDLELQWGTDDTRAKGGDYFQTDKVSK